MSGANIYNNTEYSRREPTEWKPNESKSLFLTSSALSFGMATKIVNAKVEEDNFRSEVESERPEYAPHNDKHPASCTRQG